jgi:hypothetical protein
MKTLITLLLCAAASTVHANLIDLTPGGFKPEPGKPYPTPVRQEIIWQGLQMIAHFGHVDPTGYIADALPAGYIFSDLGPDAQSAQISWDFSSLPAPWWMSRVFVQGYDVQTGAPWWHLYASRSVSGAGEGVGLPDGVRIAFIAFEGKTPYSRVPDTSSTLGLFLAGLVSLLGLTQRKVKTT